MRLAGFRAPVRNYVGPATALLYLAARLWVPAAQWQRFVHVEDRLPLLGDARAAWAVIGLWATLPAVVMASLNARHYSLAGLWAVLLCDQVIRLDSSPRGRRLALVAGLTAAGLLTLYTFGYLVAGLGAVLLVGLRDPERRRAALEGLGALAVGGAAFLATQPWLRDVLARQRDQAEPFSAELLELRAWTLWSELPRFLLADAGGVASVAVLVAALLVTWLAARWLRRGPGAVVVWLAVWTSGVLLASYLAAVSAGAAHEPRYFTIALPFVVFLPMLAWWRTCHVRAITVAAGILAAALVSANGAFWLHQARQPPAETVSTRYPVVIDNLARGVLLRILWDAPSRMQVYAADQPTLLATESRRLDCEVGPCASTPVVHVSQVQYETTEEGRAAILEQAEETRHVTRIDDIDDIADRYWLTPRVARAQPRGQARQEAHRLAPGVPAPAGSRR